MPEHSPQMQDDVSDIAGFYDRDPEHEHRRLERHQLEYEMTWRYLRRYLPERGSVMEIGAGTGRYMVELARQGYAVTAVDISAALLQKCKERLADAGLDKQARLMVADARDLTAVEPSAFDAVLLMGPLYHLVLEADRRTVLHQARQRLKPGGLIFSAWVSRLGMLGDLIRKYPHWIEDEPEVNSVMARGRDPDDYPRGGFRGYFARVSEIVPLHEGAGFETVLLAGMEPVISADDESYNRLEGTRRDKWLDLLFEISTDQSIIGASRHLLYIGKARGALT